ncbi:MAG: hypothetical protein ACHQ01_07810 [Candidatus Limnocylindrales bacterium]
MTAADRAGLERARQGLPATVTDPAVIAAIASVIRERKEPASVEIQVGSLIRGRHACAQSST